MRVLYLSNLFAPFIHDQIISISEKYNVESYSNFHVNLYSYIRNLKHSDLLDKKNISQFAPNSKEIFYPGLPKNVLRCLYTIILAKQIWIIYHKKKFDLIHAHTILPSGYAALQFSKSKKIPFIVTTHGADFYRCIPEMSKLRRTKPYSNKEINMVRSVLNEANRVICVSDNFARDVKLKFPEANVTVVPNGYRSDIFYPLDKKDLREKLHLGLEAKIIISVGSFINVKGHEYLLKAMPAIIERNENAILILIGGGILKSKYQQMCRNLGISKNVFLYEKVKHTDLAIWYNAADIFVLPSLNETFGLVVLEAMACGLPVAATQTAGPLQIIEDGVNGKLIPVENAKSISKCVNSILADNTEYSFIRKNALETAKHYQTVDLQIYNIYKTILSKQKKNKK
jgi:glycosyltransferase involved in cell wall biosynthesis